ncbi:MAG TPA: hypothetical protein VMT61_12745 [Candidatus Binataceae bacterium]|nr:hypothetical protein [Candidatus Binataceae bacterium]
MAAIKITMSISEPELDMKRGRTIISPDGGGRMRRLLSSILGYQQNLIGTPRRSIDREAQQYISTSHYEW